MHFSINTGCYSWHITRMSTSVLSDGGLSKYQWGGREGEKEGIKLLLAFLYFYTNQGLACLGTIVMASHVSPHSLSYFSLCHSF